MRRKVFHDFDAFAESVVEVDSRMMLRNPARAVWTSTAVNLGGIEIQVGELGSGNIAQGSLNDRGTMYYLPLTKGIAYTANGTVMENGTFAILDPGSEFCITTKVEHDWCCAFVPTRLSGREHEPTRPPVCHVTRPHDMAASSFRNAIGSIMSAAMACSHFEASPAAKLAAEKITNVVSQIEAAKQTQESPREGRPALSRREIIGKSREYIEARTAGHFSVRELAGAVEVSERTLRNAFQEYFGVAPARYLELRQLHAVRRALFASDPETTTVSRVYVDQGVWAFGRFAAKYRRLFGELPSETLRAKPGRET